MSTPGCACGGGFRAAPPQAGRARPWLERASGALATATLVLMPKCPACLAAYAMAWTGLGLSVAAAASVRAALLLLALATLLYAALGHGRRLACKFSINSQDVP
jgi:hypothetical protein